MATIVSRALNARTSPETLRFLRCAVAGNFCSPTPSDVARGCAIQTPCIRAASRASITRRSARSSQQKRCISYFPQSLPTNPQTHYDFFPSTLPEGPPPAGKFDIDLRKLRSEFLRLQATAHPDLHPAERKAAAEALSSRINEAYKTLQSPLLRAQYLLGLRGDHSSTDDAEKLDDQELLLEVLELREQIEEAQSEEEILELKRENGVRMAESIEVLADAFQKDRLDDAAKEAVRLRYWVNVADSLHAWEEGKLVPNLQH